VKKTRYVLLGLLKEEELSGYEMKKIIDMRMSFFWQESFGQIYPELSKMMQEGLIDVSNAESAGKIKREKIRYKITSNGEKELKQWMEAENDDADLNQNIDLHNNHKQILCVLNLGIRQAKLYIDWSKEMLDSLENEK